MTKISVNTLSLAPGEFPDLVDSVARIGAAGISPDLEQLLSATLSAAAKNIRDAGLSIATLTHRAFAFSNASEAAMGRERLLRTIDIAAQMDAQSIIMTTGGRGNLDWQDAANAFAEAIAPCVERANQAGIKLGIEPTSHLYSDVSIAHHLSDTIDIANRANMAVMMDLFACWMDADIYQALAKAAPLSPLVQISDYIYGDRALPCRAVPGDGALPMAKLISVIVRAGFTGWFDLEIIGPRLQAEGQEPGLKRAANYITALIPHASNS